MKVKDFFTKRGKQGNITDEEFTKFLEALDKVELEVPDKVDTLLEEQFLTRDRINSDPKIVGKLRAEAYDAMDDRITAVMQEIKKIDGNLVIDIETEKDTLKKITKLGLAVGKVADKAKGAGAEEGEKLKEKDKQIAEYLEKIKSINTEREAEKATLTQQFEAKEKDIVLNYALRDKINSIEFADEHKSIREAITKVVLTDLREGNHLSLNESGQIVVSTLENGVPKPKFNGNSQVTFESVLEEKVKPYIKRNNADPSGKDKPPVPPRQPQTPPSGKMTLREMQQAAAAG